MYVEVTCRRMGVPVKKTPYRFTSQPPQQHSNTIRDNSWEIQPNTCYIVQSSYLYMLAKFHYDILRHLWSFVICRPTAVRCQVLNTRPTGIYPVNQRQIGTKMHVLRRFQQLITTTLNYWSVMFIVTPACISCNANKIIDWLIKASDDNNFTRIFTKEYPQIWQVNRSLFCVHPKPTFTGEQSRLIRSTSPRPGSSWWPMRHAARIRQRVGSVPHVGQLATDSRWTRRSTSVVPPDGSAHILQHDRLFIQHVACYIHSTEAVERS